MNFSERVLAEIDKAGYTRNYVEKQLGFGNGTIMRWAQSSPSIDKVEKFANFLDLSIDYLLTGELQSMTKENGTPPLKESHKTDRQLSTYDATLSYATDIRLETLYPDDFCTKWFSLCSNQEQRRIVRLIAMFHNEDMPLDSFPSVIEAFERYQLGGIIKNFLKLDKKGRARILNSTYDEMERTKDECIDEKKDLWQPTQSKLVSNNTDRSPPIDGKQAQ